MTKSSVACRFAPLLTHYWTESSRPLMSLALIAPMLVAYESALLVFGPTTLRSGVDIWLRKLLTVAGLEQYFLLPILTCGILLAWHHVKGHPWRIGWFVLYGMLLESIVLGICLLGMGHWQNSIFGSAENRWLLAASTEVVPEFTWVAYLGAGIYEELLFRLMLLPVIAALLHIGGLPRGLSLVSSITLSSLLFSLAHYQFEVTLGTMHLANAFGDPFEWVTFSFRCLAGVVFSLLFVYRGFGVAAGAHVLYDILLTA